MPVTPGPPLNGPILKAFRQTQGLTIYRLARKSGIDTSYLRRLELGKQDQPHPDLIQRLADALQCPMEALLAQSPESSATEPDHDNGQQPQPQWADSRPQYVGADQ